ncbi:HlyD family efflux transporter periplasmic adaptor subunit [Candidatus Roizmanbacteria bacterium]|nr:HlyD family efflux transporter periplasmic adaptor subunit [Candidatus Roizmanbacteria bacterium]
MLKRIRKLPLKWKLILGLILLVVVGIVLQVSAKMFQKPGYVLGKVARSTISEYVTESGKISANSNVPLYSPANGVVDEIFVANGEVVKVGQKLFAIKSTATEQEKSQALATYLAAKSMLDAAQSGALKLQASMFDKWQSFKELAENDTYETADGAPKHENRALAEFHISENQWLAAEKDYKQQQNVIAQAQAAVSSTYALYQATQNATVKATAAGVVANISIGENSVVGVSDPKPLAVISSTATTEAALLLSENDVFKVKEGQLATLDVKPFHSKKYHGTVTRVDAIGTEEKGVVRYTAYIRISDPDGQLRQGMNVDAAINTNNKERVLAIPNAAVKPYKGGRAVRVVGKNGVVEYRTVVTGIRGKDKTEILSGLQENQEFIISLSNEQIKRPSLFGT